MSLVCCFTVAVDHLIFKNNLELLKHFYKLCWDIRLKVMYIQVSQFTVLTEKLRHILTPSLE